MRTHGKLGLAALLFALLAGLAVTAPQPPDAPNVDEQREQAVMQRFLVVLEKNPRRGTALDRLYGHHVERGTLDALVKEFADRAAKDAADGVAPMIVGLLEAQRGQEAKAVVAFKEAEKRRADDPLASYYLGQSLVLVGQPDAAAEAFERAITRKPNRTDLLDIFQALGRVYQRAQKTEQALAVWARLEKLFPDDLRVQEQIATTLAEEGQFEQALPRYERLAKAVKDPYRQTTFRMEAAELKVRLKRGPQALADLEGLLGELNPDNWLYRDVRRKIEEVFLRNDDLAGLSKYYEGFLAKHPDDVEAMARLARGLASQGRIPESREWLKKAVEKAPTRRELRQAMIEQFVAEQKYADAVAQYEAMDKADPNNPDTLREWGKLLLRDTARPEAARKQAAVAVWRRLLERRKNDPVATAQVADLVRSAGLSDDALALYRQAVEQAPGNAQYREYLGEYLHSLKRKDEALAAWRPIAEGANRNAKNLARLAEVFAGFSYRKEAIAALADALTLEKDDFNLLIRHADLLHQDEQNDAALVQLDAAGKLATNDEEREQVMLAQIKVYQATDTLTKRIDDLQKELDAAGGAASAPRAIADRWHRLARYHEAARQVPEAVAAILKALERDATAIPVLASAARLHESGGNLLAAADTYRRLAAVDRRFRTEYLTSVAKLEARLGRREQALQAGRDLLAAAPGNPENFKFYADLCFQLGEGDEGLESLRKGVRVNPSDPQGLLTLSAALAERFRTGEAIELLWRAFEKTPELEGKVGTVARLTELYLQNNQFDKLLERLERERREADKQREMTICIAQAYQAAGDFGTARQQLERLLTENARDTQLLGQLSQLAENEGDAATAVKYQRQLEKASPTNREVRLRLAQLLVKAGESDEAATIWVDLVAGEPEPHRNHQAIDALFANAKHDTAAAVLSRLLAQKPTDWELLYREGVALHALGKRDEAARRFRTVLELKLTDEEPSAAAKWRKKQNSSRPTGTAVASSITRPVALPETVPVLARTQAIYEIRHATGIEMRYYGPGGQVRTWAPDDYGQARLACLGWLFAYAQKDNKPDEFAKEVRAAAVKAGADARAKWDWYYFLTLKQDVQGTWEAAKALAGLNDPAAAWVYLNGLPSRVGSQRAMMARRRPDQPDTTPPLPAPELEQVLTAYRRVRQQRPEWITQPILTNVLTELKRANRTADGDQVFKDAIAAAVTPPAIQQMMAVAAERGDSAAALALYDKLDKQPSAGRGTAPPTRMAVDSLSKLMKPRADAKAHADLLKLFEAYLSSQRRHRLANPPQASASSASRSPMATPVRYLVALGGGGYRSMIVDYPSPNDYYDAGAIQLLRTAYDLYRRDDLVSDLFALVRQRRDAAGPAEKVEWQLAIGYLHWWNQEKEQALTELTAAGALVPADANMRFELAGLRERNNEPDEALAILDALTPLDHTVMQRREEAALRLAVRTGNVDRARQAADRLFGLRLDAEKQVELASQMHRLGMHEAAETVLARAARQAGNRTAALIRLMNQYQSQNQPDLAVQIARQLLRKGPSMNFTPYAASGADGRPEAIQVLARSGKLTEMIERAEAQLKSSPKSLPAYQTLIDYYKAAGNKEKLKATALAMAKVKPEDGRTRFQIAQQLAELGEHAAAADEYTAALKKEPSLFAYRYWDIQQVFHQAKKTDQLIQLFEEIDLKGAGGNYYVYVELVQPLMSDEKTREQGLKLFRKVWQSFPDYRPYIMANFYDDSLWQLPELYEFAREAILPKGETIVDPWQGSDQIMSYSGDGRVTGLYTRLLDVARKQNRLVALSRDLDEAVKKHPTWNSGKALRVVLLLQRGRSAEARQLWQELLDDKKDPMPAMAKYIFGQEIENYGAMRDLVLRTYESAVEDTIKEQQFDLSYSPIRRLVKLYEQEDRKADARALVIKAFQGYGGNEYNPEYNAYRKISSGSAAATMLTELGYPVEAVRIFGGLLDDTDTLELAQRYYGGSSGSRAQVERGLKTALRSLKPDEMTESVRELLQPRDGAKPGAALDLMVMVPVRDLTETKLTSVLADALEATAKTPELRAESAAKLAELASRQPRDLTVLVAAALAAFAENKSDKTADAVERLAKLADEQPLETLPPNGRANSRQRAAALPQVALWLVARECLKHDPLRANGLKLGERALAAARRQLEPSFALAVLREWGQLEHDRGDKAAAEKRWGEMLELVVPPPAPKRAARLDGRRLPHQPEALARNNGQSSLALRAGEDVASRSSDNMPTLTSPFVALAIGQMPPPAPPVPVTATFKSAPPATAPPRVGGLVPSVTIAQFDQARQIATMAADRGLPALSQKAIRDALRGGPPVQNVSTNVSTTMAVRTVSGMVMSTAISDASNPYGNQVETNVANLVGRWRRAGASAADVYETLAAIVLPDARPAEVFLYPRPLSYGLPELPRSLGLLLAETAAQAKKVEDLRRRADARAKQPLGELSAHVLLAHAAATANDAAGLTAQLDWFAQRLQKDTLQITAEQVAHVALPALDRPEHEPAAVALLDRAAKNLASTRAERQASGLMLHLARHHFAKARPEEGKRLLQEVMASALKGAMRSGDVSAVQQAQRVAAEYIRAGMLTDALELMGMAVDLPASQQRYVSNDMLAGLTGAFYRQLAGRPAAERLALLKPWAMPTAGRQSVRLLGAFVPTDAPPAVFGTPPAPADGVVSTAGLLIDAASAAGQLNALADELKALADQKVEGARPLYVLAQIARGHSTAVEKEIAEYAAELKKRVEAPPAQPTGRRIYYSPYDDGQSQETINWADYLLARACMLDPQLAALGEGMADQLLNQAKRLRNWPMIMQLRNDLAAGRAKRAAAAGAGGTARDAGLAYWHPAFTLSRTTQTGNRLPSWWVAQDGHVAHLLGPDQQFLLFDLPLTGTFAFSVDAFQGRFAEGHPGYGGLVYEANLGESPSTVWPVGKSETLSRLSQTLRTEAFNRFTFEVTPGKVKCLVNGQPFYEGDDLPPTSPWLMLYCDRVRHTVFRNFELTGKPEIPSEVRLTHGDRLNGWACSLFGESQPPKLRKDEPTTNYATYYDEYEDGRVMRRQPEKPVYDWTAKDGVIECRKLDDPGAKLTPSHLGYVRPLRSGDTLRYEFFYQPGDTEVHPCLGRLAFLLEPDGVRRRWLTGGGDDDWTGLKADNVRDVPEQRRGPKTLPLKARDWNALTVAMGEKSATLELNGAVIYEYPLGPDDGRSFGLYHDKARSAVKVRNAVLTGGWPKALPAAAAADLLVRGAGDSLDGPARRTLIGESFFPRNARPTLQAARPLPPAERYARLAAWVLPNPERKTFQLAGDYTTANPAPPYTPAMPAVPRSLIGGEVEAPALELVALAKELSKLDDLLKVVESADTPADPRSQLAMLALVRAALGRDAEAAAALAQLKPLVEKQPLEAPTWQRWPELLAVVGTHARPGCGAAALALLEVMTKQARAMQTQKAAVADKDDWLLTVHHYRARAQHPTAAWGANPRFAHWVTATQQTADSRGRGRPAPLWLPAEGGVTHYPGHAQDSLYFRSPLKGDFEVQAELTTFDWREGYVGYGGTRFEVKHDRKSFDLFRIAQHIRAGKIDPQLPNLGEWYRYRLVVKDGAWKAFINDRELIEEPLPADADPWLILTARRGNVAGFRNMRIVGTPIIPDSVDLLAAEDLAGWQMDTGGGIGTEYGQWLRRGEELVAQGQRPRPQPDRPTPPRTWREQAVYYHRPLAEDGTLDYEFFYEPDKTHVHPALDRLCLLLEPKGVRVHWLTDGTHERTGLTPDNATTEPPHRRGPAELPLKARAWNKVTLKLTGDTLGVALNGTDVYQRPLESTNQRTFGLFHYADDTAVRVRHVIMKGSWPKTLPPAEEMFRVGK